MMNKEHLDILRQGTGVWNEWREGKGDVKPDLSGAELSEADLNGANLSGVNLSEANLYYTKLNGADLSRANLFQAKLDEAHLQRANLSGANLREAHLSWWDTGGQATDLSEADLSEADLTRADLRKADLSRANLTKTDLSEANLSGAYLTRATMVETKLEGAQLNGCKIYGISAWDLKLNEKTTQSDLIITPRDQAIITVDNLEVAQFIYLMLNNEKIRDVIHSITSKGVLILGRFTEERKTVLDAIREQLRRRGYLPIMFDFEPTASRNLTETVTTLARMSRFVIADITDARSIPQELQAIVPSLPSLPVQPIILESQYEYAMFKDFLDFQWVMLPYRYQSPSQLITTLAEKVINPAEMKAAEIAERRRQIEAQLAK